MDVDPSTPGGREAAVGEAAVDAYLSPASFRRPRLLVESAWLEHAPFASWLVHALEPRVLVELGTHNGFSYFTFCQAVQEAGLETACHAVDHWRGDDQAGFYGRGVFEAVMEHNERHFAPWSRLVPSSFDEAVEVFDDGSIDLLHVDGRHAYEDVRHDYLTWMPKLSSRSVVLFHDTREWGGGFGVHRLWREISGGRPAFEFRHAHGLGVLLHGTSPAPAVERFLDAVSDPVVAREAAEAYARLGRAVSLEYELGIGARPPAGAVARGVAAVATWLKRLVGGPVRT